jgi:hypothetical protein
MTTPIPFGEPIDWPADIDVTTAAGKDRWQAASWINAAASAKIQSDATDRQAQAIAAQTAQNKLNVASANVATDRLAVANAAQATAVQNAADAQEALRKTLAEGVQVDRDRLTWDQARFPIPAPAPVPSPAPPVVPAPMHALVALLQAAISQWQAAYPEA